MNKFICLIVTNIGECIKVGAPSMLEAERIARAAMDGAHVRGFQVAYVAEILETIRAKVVEL